jgi:hypothetical protein
MSKRVKFHHSRKAGGDQKVLEPGTSKDPKTFVQLWKREGQLAAYALYNRRDEFRRFAMSAWVLRPYVQAFTGRSKQVRQDHVLAYIGDQKDEMQSEADPIVRYAEQNDGIHGMQCMALAIAQMRRRLQNPVSEEYKISQEDQDDVSHRFKELTGRVVPAVDVSKVTTTDFGPYPDRGECELEAYNRCFNMLMYVNYSLSASTWPSRFDSLKWDEGALITTADLPNWMQGKEAKAKDCPAPDRMDESNHREISL